MHPQPLTSKSLSSFSQVIEHTKSRVPLTAAERTVQNSPDSSIIQSDVSERAESEIEATVTTLDTTDDTISLKYDQFVELVNSATSKTPNPWTSSIQLPEDLRNDLEFNDKGQDLSYWTCTPSAHVASDEIPLRIDGHSVVLPVEYKYPLTGMFSPPPDPHPLFISPFSQLSDEDIHHVFSTFPACVGFYLLVNGFLQVLMPDDFDYEEGVPSFPSEFGGLKVSLIPESACPTAGEASASTPTTTTTSTRTRFERMFGQSSAQSTSAQTTGSSSDLFTNTAGITVGCAVRAIVPGSKSKRRFEGKTGVAISPRDDNSKKYVTIPTHLMTDAIIASKTRSLDSDTWKKDVKICVASNSAEVSCSVLQRIGKGLGCLKACRRTCYIISNS